MIFIRKKDKWLYNALLEIGDEKGAQQFKESVKGFYFSCFSLVVSIIVLGLSIFATLMK